MSEPHWATGIGSGHRPQQRRVCSSNAWGVHPCSVFEVSYCCNCHRHSLQHAALLSKRPGPHACCGVLQRPVVQCTAMYGCHMLQCTALLLPCAFVCCGVLQCTVRCSTVLCCSVLYGVHRPQDPASYRPCNACNCSSGVVFTEMPAVPARSPCTAATHPVPSTYWLHTEGSCWTFQQTAQTLH